MVAFSKNLKDFSKVCFCLVLLTSVLLLAACSAGTQSQSCPENVLIYANLNERGSNREAIDEFNRTHEDVQIEVRDYPDEEGKEDKTRLLAEIIAGKGPDIIDMGYDKDAFTTIMPYRRMAQAGYLEDLWPYVENDPELGRDALLEAPLKAAEVDGGLYIAFRAVRISTLVGAESVVGDRTSWTLEELMEAFASMPPDSTILDYLFSRSSVFTYIACMCLDDYVDWETGECNFDSESFRTLVEFVASFPEKSPFDQIDGSDFKAVMELNREAAERRLSGKQMLEAAMLGKLEELLYLDLEFGGKAACVGYPVGDGSVGSSFFIAGRSLAISSTCRNKEAAWDFIRQTYLPTGKREPLGPIPINLKDYEMSKNCRKAVEREDGFGLGVKFEPRSATAEEEQRYENLINSIDKIDLCDKTVFDLVEECLGPYFAGDKTLDETVEMIQNRVGLYISESQ